VIRYDFHFTTDGWRISEANSDVPGGYAESTFFTELFADSIPGAVPSGLPARALADALAAIADGKPIALLAAPGYMEDQQVVAYLGGLLHQRGCTTRVATPAQLQWQHRRAYLPINGRSTELGAILRFYQGEWLAKLPSSCHWPLLLRGGLTPVTNCGAALISESKRFPLLWDALSTPLPTWRALLPQTCDPRQVPWPSDPGWLLKTAFCNTGDTVSSRESLDHRAWSGIARSVRWFPSRWIAQRRFTTLPIETPIGPLFPCLGIYTVNGRASGAYARLGRRYIIDFTAIDAAVLVEEEDS
jgi:hypothetical protein